MQPSPGPVEMTRPQTRDKEYHWIYIFGTHVAPAGRGFDWQLLKEYPFALIAAGMESLVTGFGSQAKKKRATFLARASTLYSILFEDIALIERELGPTDEEVPKERKNISVKPHYQTSLPRLKGIDPRWSGSAHNAQSQLAPVFQSKSEIKSQKMKFENKCATVEKPHLPYSAPMP